MICSARSRSTGSPSAASSAHSSSAADSDRAVASGSPPHRQSGQPGRLQLRRAVTASSAHAARRSVASEPSRRPSTPVAGSRPDGRAPRHRRRRRPGRAAEQSSCPSAGMPASGRSCSAAQIAIGFGGPAAEQQPVDGREIPAGGRPQAARSSAAGVSFDHQIQRGRRSASIAAMLGAGRPVQVRPAAATVAVRRVRGRQRRRARSRSPRRTPAARSRVKHSTTVASRRTTRRRPAARRCDGMRTHQAPSGSSSSSPCSAAFAAARRAGRLAPSGSSSASSGAASFSEARQRGRDRTGARGSGRARRRLGRPRLADAGGNGSAAAGGAASGTSDSDAALSSVNLGSTAQIKTRRLTVAAKDVDAAADCGDPARDRGRRRRQRRLTHRADRGRSEQRIGPADPQGAARSARADPEPPRRPRHRALAHVEQPGRDRSGGRRRTHASPARRPASPSCRRCSAGRPRSATSSSIEGAAGAARGRPRIAAGAAARAVGPDLVRHDHADLVTLGAPVAKPKPADHGGFGGGLANGWHAFTRALGWSLTGDRRGAAVRGAARPDRLGRDRDPPPAARQTPPAAVTPEAADGLTALPVG